MSNIEATLWKVVPSNQRNNAGFFDRSCTIITMERLAFCALIKHNLQKDQISYAKDFISVQMQTLALKCSSEI